MNASLKGTKIIKSAWQQETEREFADMAYRIRMLEEENGELRRMLGRITLYLCGKSSPNTT